MTYFSDYVFKNGRTLLVDEAGNECDFCEEVRVVAVIIDAETRAMKARIEITHATGEIVSVTVSRERMVTNPVSALSKFGLSVSPVTEYSVTLAELLLETETTARRMYAHRELGWGKCGKERCFFGYRAIGASVKSKFHPAKKLRPKGSFEQWRDGLSPFLAEKPELQLALAIGACAPIAALLQEAEVLELVSVFALIGQSSMGKTSALKMMASIWGKGSIRDGVIDTLLDTPNRFFANLGKKNGFPSFIDETSLNDGSFTSTLYQISMGKEKGRSNPDGSPRKTNHWLGAIVFTGETSMFAQTNGNDGLFARLIEFSYMWTKDDKSAEALTRLCAENYGTAYVPLIEYLMKTPIEELVRKYESARLTLEKEIVTLTGVEKRLMKQYALLLMTSRIIREVWQIPMFEDCIILLLTQTHKEHLVHSTVQMVYQSVKEQVLANQDKFPHKKNGATSYGIWGERDFYKNSHCVWITENRFEVFLQNAGKRNSRDLLAQLHEKGCLAKFGDRYKKDRALGNTMVKCYCVLLGASCSSEAEKKIKSTLVSTGSQVNLLLDEEDEQNHPAENAVSIEERGK